jgi:hypothetical protein
MMQLVAGDLNNDGNRSSIVCNNCGITNGGFVVEFMNTSSGGIWPSLHPGFLAQAIRAAPS